MTTFRLDLSDPQTNPPSQAWGKDLIARLKRYTFSDTGNGMASVVANVALTAQTASIGATDLFTPPVDGTYRVSVYLLDTTAGGAGTVLATIGWTDDAQAQTLSTTTVNLTVLGAFVQQTIYVRALSSAAITYATTVVGLVGADYALFVNVERVS